MLASISTRDAPAEKDKYSTMHPNLRLAELLFAVTYSMAFWLIVLLLTFRVYALHASN
jgi:hypothetical protein